MSRAFVKESDSEDAVTPMCHIESGQPNYMTPRGETALKSRIADAIEARTALAADPSRLDVKAALAQADADLAYLQGRLEKAIIVPIPVPPTNTIGIGAHVTALDEHGQQHAFQVVGEDEVDVAHGRVSWLSPIGAAVMGQEAGGYVDWERPAGALALEILEVRYD